MDSITIGLLTNAVILIISYFIFRIQFGRWHKYSQDDSHYVLSWITPLAFVIVSLTRLVGKLVDIGLQQLSRL